MSDDRWEPPLARNTDPETSHMAAAEVDSRLAALVESFMRSHDNDPEKGWTHGEIYDTKEVRLPDGTPMDRDNIWKRLGQLTHCKPPVLEWIYDSGGKKVKRRWPGTRRLQAARRIIRKPPAEEKVPMINPGLIDEAYKAYQEIAVLAPLRAQSPFVPGDGPLNAPVLIVGEAPGEQEVKQLRPFVGPSGQLLDKLLAERGLLRWMCYVTNTVCYRPPGNRTPERFEIAVSRERLLAEIEAIQPMLVITLGAVARRALKPQGDPVSVCHGKREPLGFIHNQDYRPGDPIQLEAEVHQDCMMLPTFHPAAALRDTRVLELMRADLTAMPDWREVLGVGKS